MTPPYRIPPSPQRVSQETQDLEAKLCVIDRKVSELASRGGEQLRGQLHVVTQANIDLRHKVEKLERWLHDNATAAATTSLPTPPAAFTEAIGKRLEGGGLQLSPDPSETDGGVSEGPLG